MRGSKNNLLNQVFSRLTVISLSRMKVGIQRCWQVKCECGTIKNVQGRHLLNGMTKSCGCLVIETHSIGPGVAAFNCLYSGYKANARNKKREFTLTKDEFKKLVDSNCVYCGDIPSTIRKQSGCPTTYTHNGIDRLDNNKGYTLENCVTCCSTCNYAKRNKTEKEFKEWIQRLVNHQNHLS